MPHLHRKTLRSYVADHTVKITFEKGRGGGTGSHITHNDKVFIITNRHICDASTTGNLVIHYKAEKHVRKIIKKSDLVDLCLVEAVADSGLYLAASISPGDYVAMVGHPLLKPLVMTEGEYGGELEVLILPAPHPIFPFKFELGILHTAPGTRGNSGSPVVNFFGLLVGVHFAGVTYIDHLGYTVPLDEIKEFVNDATK